MYLYICITYIIFTLLRILYRLCICIFVDLYICEYWMYMFVLLMCIKGRLRVPYDIIVYILLYNSVSIQYILYYYYVYIQY